MNETTTGTVFLFEAMIQSDWIDYNGHMRDAYFGLVFSLAVDAMQDDVGFDEAYRQRSGCTIYLLEDHKYYLREVKEGTKVRVETLVLDCDRKRFHLYQRMFSGGQEAAICEFMELHVNQLPTPHAEAMPEEIYQRLLQAMPDAVTIDALKRRSGRIKLKRNPES